MVHGQCGHVAVQRLDVHALDARGEEAQSAVVEVQRNHRRPRRPRQRQRQVPRPGPHIQQPLQAERRGNGGKSLDGGALAEEALALEAAASGRVDCFWHGGVVEVRCGNELVCGIVVCCRRDAGDDCNRKFELAQRARLCVRRARRALVAVELAGGETGGFGDLAFALCKRSSRRSPCYNQRFNTPPLHGLGGVVGVGKG
mmetsp:Transcript_19525/g.65984  ORF Transcript_19525/g.65984 Transcript_19525/m.65984 type:complete len:200 (-) Transcript_19525:371-970(-)